MKHLLGYHPNQLASATPAIPSKTSKNQKVFGHWKRNLGYRRVRHMGLLRNRLELEFKCILWNLRRCLNLAPAA